MATTASARTRTTKPAAAKKRRPAAKQATRTTAHTATSSSTQPSTRVEQAQQVAQRAVLIPLGAALEARERVAGTVAELVAPVRSRTALERQLTHFERRGGRARKQLEREVRRTRTRIERETRQARRGLERRREEARRNVGSNVEAVTDRAQNVVQNGVNAGMKLVNGAQDRIASVA